MSSGRLVRKIVRALDRIVPADRDPAHLRTGRAGEEAAYFYLRERGYVIVARNWRSPRCHGELDLVGWDGDVLCFIEVKTRSTRGLAPAEAAVDQEKQEELGKIAEEYLRRMSSLSTSRAKRGSPTPGRNLSEGRAPSLRSGYFQKPNFRFDVISVYVENSSHPPDITLYRNAFSLIK